MIWVDFLAIFISIIALVISIVIWISDKKSVWYWNVVINPMQENFKNLKGIDIIDKEKIITVLNRYIRTFKKSVEFLELGIKKDKVEDLKIYIESNINKICLVIFENENGANYLELISSFETELYKRIAKLVLKKI